MIENLLKHRNNHPEWQNYTYKIFKNLGQNMQKC